ncbi:MAG: hypothetical protein Q9181_001687 [Wetmoreana brouardii]
MPRKAFVQDLQQATQGFSHLRVSEVGPGVEDGSLTFRYRLQAPTELDFVIQALVTDVGEYPSSHMYMVYTTSENIPARASTALEDVGTLDGLTVGQMLSKVAKVLDTAMAGSQDNPLELDDDPMETDDPATEPSEAELSDDSASESIDAWSPKSPSHPTFTTLGNRNGTPSFRARAEILAANRRIRSDLRAAKEAGFRVGHLGGLTNGAQLCIVTISIRVSKLGISDEAMQAWHLDPSQYFLLLVRYTAGYRPMEDLFGRDSTHRSKMLSFRVGLSRRYKVSLDEAIRAFSEVKKKDSLSTDPEILHDNMADRSTGLQPLFIGRPLQDLMNDRLLAIIDYRKSLGFGWKGAEAWYIDRQGSNWSSYDGVDKEYYAPEFSSRAAALPRVATNDHLSGISPKSSFPLVAMQFALRHLVRCTEFCLVCHARVEADFEALKPYVCSKPLCLYQYMAFGFGPSIEHDIVSQPHVVDLLISFCYSSAAAGRLKNLPTGMSLSVPAPSLMPSIPHITATSYRPSFNDPNGQVDGVTKLEKSYAVQPLHTPKIYKAKFDQSHMELILAPGETPLYPNQWVFVKVPGNQEERWHCRVVEALHPTIRLGPPVHRISDKEYPTSSENTRPQPSTNTLRTISSLTTAAPSGTESSKYPEVEFVIYDQNFDDLAFLDKQTTICMLLETLPSVSDMKTYLESKSSKDMTLASWQDRISPAAAGVLRWIIASNRSCIVQVDRIEGETLSASEERVTGMPQWMQFRFAQGAPDKEQRFVQSIRDVTGQKQHPSLYAWHGSPLHNWHSIVREGLHFQDTANGRAYGHGVYHSQNVNTSLGYSYGHYYPRRDEGTPAGQWPHSQLSIGQAIALNEIVNAPDQYVSKSPHLVVAQLDWIQTRYLFVKINAGVQFGQEVTPKEVYSQDPTYTPTGSDGKQIVIPITAVSKSRRPVSKKTGHGDKRMKVSNGSAADDAILLSDDTDIEDLQILLSEDEEGQSRQPTRTDKPPTPKALPHLPKGAETDFVPGTLDHVSLPFLEPPPFATTVATKALQRELNTTLKIQDSHPSHQLGWYIDREIINNMYQWIIELHSFETDLPLTTDLKAKGLKSVVMEVRFGKDYPMSPPFVRIIRPRFLSFMAGGGGHVTAGGALCMELLTNSGWSAVSNMESVLLQVRLALSSTDPKPARLEPGPVRDYGVGEAIEAYIRACNAHGVREQSSVIEHVSLTRFQWQIPPDFRTSYTPTSSSGSNKPLPNPLKR